MNKTRLVIVITALTGVTALAAALHAAPGGDLAKQQPTYKLKGPIPPAPVLSPEEQLKTFKLPPGFKIELVAAEPAVEEPIALTFDPDGRIYVVEMRGYMPTMDGKGELDPVGRVKLLESTNRDGRYDKATVFLDNLIAPRAVGLAGDGVLVAEPPNVWFCRDTNGDGVADEKTAVFTDYGSRNPNPEHMANGLTWMLDNWYYNAKWNARFRYSKGKFLRDTDIGRGQWGIAQDDTGRLFSNGNSSMLHTDFAPAQYLARNPYFPAPAGLNVRIANNAVFPSRVTPGVNRGYTNVLDNDAKLRTVTAACGPVIYRGDQWPAEFRGNAFVCEPSGNLVSRQVLSQDGLNVTAKGAQHAGLDFLTSLDERFRPVNLYTGPDGAMYVVDLYHGILQHKAYLSAYLADQVQKRKLDDNGGHRGRIWKITHESFDRDPKGSAFPQLSKASIPDLVKTLSHPNGWWRDTAQRLVVERQEESAQPLLEAVVAGEATDTTPLAKLNALYALQGLDKLDDDAIAGAVKDADPRVRVAALRVGEVLVKKRIGSAIVEAIQTLADDPDVTVQHQVLLMASPDYPELQPAASKILAARAGEPLFRAAAIAGAAGRELEVLQSLLTDKAFDAAPAAGQTALLNDLAECVIRGRSADRIEKLLDLIAAQPQARQQAMLSGMAEAVAPDPKSKAPRRRLRMTREPAALVKLAASDNGKVADLARKIDDGLSWPNKPGDTTKPLKPLTDGEQRLFTVGREVYTNTCAQCHQPSGLGQEGVAPHLVDSEWVLGSPERLVRITLHGVAGPIKVGKKTVDLEMPGLHALSDEQIAGVLTYTRREWGHEGNPISPDTVAKIRKVTAERGQTQWTADELMKLP
jgi:mono/diheme cytochrome c family protein/glucose/arabinose dehydrogenase